MICAISKDILRPNRHRLPLTSASVVMLCTAALPALAQLPPTNMGKNVGQPGDNQYMPAQQLRRHSNYIDRTGPGSSVYIPTGSGAGAGGGGGAVTTGGAYAIDPMVLMWSNAPKVDISVEPIACDEPIAPADFPPLPARILLPISPANNWAQQGGGGAAGGYTGGYGGGGTGGAATAGVVSPVYQGMHEHYAHTAPGSYLLPHGGSAAAGGRGGGYAADPGAAVPGYMAGGGIAAGLPQSRPGAVLPQHGYYKCTSAAAPGTASETFNSNSGRPGGMTPPPRYTGASSSDLAKMGMAPKLDGEQDKASAPEAPQAALVSQSQTVDLSLPDDEFVSRYGLQDSGGKRFAKAVGRRVGVMMYSAASGVAARAYSMVP